MTHAAAAPIPTQITVETDGLWTECSQCAIRSGERLGFQGIAPQPVLVIKTLIDRMNAEVAARQ